MIKQKIKYYKKRVMLVKRKIAKTKKENEKIILMEELASLVKIRNMFIEQLEEIRKEII